MDDINAGVIMRSMQQTAAVDHRFAIGSIVRLRRTIPLRNAVPGLYEVLAKLPQQQGEFQYRVKSEREPYQRIMKEGEVERA
jgi:predicted transposase YdaD